MSSGGVRFGPYLLLRPVARGGMGVVHEAQAPDGARVALKVLAAAATPVALGRFDRERRLLGELSAAHGFVPLLDAGQHQGRPWLVMPFMAGGSLRERLERGTLGVEAAVELGHQLASAIGRAHARGIVHRDLKPENVLFERPGDDAAPRIADLGLAKHFRGEGREGARSATLSRSGAVLGTACYMAPEQLEDARAVGPPADVFALGQIVHECVTGVTPFLGDGMHDTFRRLLAGEREPLRAHAPDAPAWLEAVLDTALARDPAARFADGRAFARALAARGRGVAPAGDRRRGVGLVVAGGAGALAALGVVAVLVGRDRAPIAPAPVAVERPALESPAATEPEPVEPAPVEHEPTVDDPSAPPPDAEEAATLRRLLGEGRRLFVADDLAGARALADQVLARLPDDAQALALRGACRGAPEGLVDLDRAVERSAAGDAWILQQRAVLRSTVDDLAGAREDLDRAVTVADDAASFAGRSELRRAMGDHQGALADAEAAIARDATSAFARWAAARAHLAVGDHARAEEHLRATLDLHPDHVLAMSQLGNLLSVQRRYDEALPWFERVLERAPDEPVSLAGRGAIRLHVQRRPADALLDLERAVALRPQDALSRRHLAVCYWQLDQLERARDMATEALALEPDDVKALQLRMAAHTRLGDRSRALDDLARIEALDPAFAANDPIMRSARRDLRGE